jgi:hypothetical protein
VHLSRETEVPRAKILIFDQRGNKEGKEGLNLSTIFIDLNHCTLIEDLLPVGEITYG